MKFFERFTGSPKKKEIPEPSNAQELDALKSEHLAKGARPIIACVGTKEQIETFGNSEEELLRKKEFEEMVKNAEDIDWYEKNTAKIYERGFLTAGEKTYVISSLDENPKKSNRLEDCSSVIITGQHKKTGKNTSFVSHQNPLKFVRDSIFKPMFVKDLKTRLAETKEQCIPGTVDAVIFGGTYELDDDYDNMQGFRDDYRRSIALLSEEIKKVFGFEPSVITGPKSAGAEDFIYDTKNRRLYIERPEEEIGNSFSR